MIVSCYSMDLYRVNIPTGVWKHDDMTYGYGTGQFIGRTEGECKGEARRKGWRFVGGDVICPHCVKAGKAK
jgi:hypothetical protein